MTGIDGIVSGLDTSAIINGVIATMRRPIAAMEITKGGLEFKRTAYRDLNTLLGTLETATEALDSVAEFGSFGVTSSQGTSISATASGAAVAGNYDVSVVSLAQNSMHLSRGFATSTSLMADGAATITIAGQTTAFQIDTASGNNTLAGLATYINDNVAGATAYVVDTGVGATPFNLVINSDASGVANGVNLTYTQQGAGTSPGFSVANTAVDAVMNFGGLTVQKPSNTVTDLLPGLTLELQAPTIGAARISVSADTTAMADSVDTFVDAYNAVMDFMIEQRGTADNEGGALATDSTVRAIERRLAGVISGGFATGAITGLNEIGIGTAQDGRLEFDRTDFETAVADHYGDVMTMLSGPTGLFASMTTVASDVTDPVTGLLEPRIDGLSTEIDDMAVRIEVQESRLVVEEARLRAEFTALELIMAGYQSTENFLTQQFEAMGEWT
jgi:flagellar hook-associated protein 2